MKDELTKATVNFIRHCYGDGEATIRRDILKALRTGKTIDSPRAQNALPYLLEKVPEEFLTKNGIPTNFERAFYEALRLYALHQQSIDWCVYETSRPTKEVQDDLGITFFKGLKLLRNKALENDSDSKALDRRVQTVIAMTTFNGTSTSLEQLSGIMKSRIDVKIDYTDLANDLYWLQFDENCIKRVHFRWANQYFG